MKTINSHKKRDKIKKAWENVLYLLLRPSTAYVTDINNTPTPFILYTCILQMYI